MGERIIVLVHGILTRAFWYDTVIPVLSDLDETSVKPITFGYFDLLSFLLPGHARRRPQDIVLSGMYQLIEKHSADGRHPQISVIAHSFGTYTVIKALERSSDITIHNLILCGSVVRSDYDFSTVMRKVENVIINDVGFRDVWPVVARVASFGYGCSGTYGFEHPYCQNRHHDLKHSEFFNFGFVHKYWWSIFNNNQIVPSNFNRASRRRPLIQIVLSHLPASSLPCVLIFAIALSVGWLCYRMFISN